MFQINRKEYTNMIDALCELQNVLETERETQQFMSDGSEGIFKGAAGMAMRAGLTTFLNQGIYEKAYQQCKKMKESMESLLPLVIKLLWEADTLATHLEEDVLTNSFIPYYVLYPQSNTEIFMLDETYVNSVEQGCEDLVRRGQLLKNQMQAAINKCAGIIDCSAEQAALDEAEKSVLRITDFQEAFQSYVVGVRDLDESLRLDFALLTDEENIECGKALQNVICNAEISDQIIEEVGVITITETQLKEFGWQNITPESIESLNNALLKYDIQTEESLIMFLATCAAESEYGLYTLEQGDDEYFIDNGYTRSDRGVGYIQLTHKNAQIKFLEYMGDNYTGIETAEYINENYDPWMVSAYVWSIETFGEGVVLNNYVQEKGLSLETYLASQYFINGYVDAIEWDDGAEKIILDTALREVVKGNYEYEINFIKKEFIVKGNHYPLPNRWKEREDAYNDTLAAFKTK